MSDSSGVTSYMAVGGETVWSGKLLIFITNLIQMTQDTQSAKCLGHNLKSPCCAASMPWKMEEDWQVIQVCGQNSQPWIGHIYGHWVQFAQVFSFWFLIKMWYKFEDKSVSLNNLNLDKKGIKNILSILDFFYFPLLTQGYITDYFVPYILCYIAYYCTPFTLLHFSYFTLFNCKLGCNTCFDLIRNHNQNSCSVVTYNVCTSDSCNKRVLLQSIRTDHHHGTDYHHTETL